MLPSGLSMLWERVEAGDALGERFGFGDLDGVATWAAEVLRETWGIGVTGVSRVVISDRNAIAWVAGDGADLVVKWSQAPERFAGLDASTRLLRLLDAQGVPVAAPIGSVDGHDRVVVDGPAGALSVAVLPELDGTWLDVDDEAAVRSAGACLAAVHDALATIPYDASTTTVRPQPIGDWVRAWSVHGDHGFAPEASQRLAAALATTPELAGAPQLVHNDFRAANVLMRGPEVVGVLDFDDVVVDHPVHDLAKASVYLGTRFTDWRPISPTTRQVFRAGYESVRPLTPDEARWYEILLLWQGLMAIPGEDDPGGWASAVSLLDDPPPER